MKIIYVAVFDNEGISSDTSKSRALEKLGHTVLSYNYRVRGLELGDSKRDAEIVRIAQQWVPDIIIFAKCNGISPRVFEQCKTIAPVCYWFADPLVTYKNVEFYEKTKICDFFTCDKENVLEEASKYNSNCHIVCDGYDSQVEFPKEQTHEYDVGFIGNLYGDRHQKLQQLKYPVQHITNAYGKDHSEAVGQIKVNLNFCTSMGPSDRVFKTLAANGFLMTDDWLGREAMFEDGKHLVVFKDISDLNNKIEFYLKNPELMREIANNGYDQVQKFSRLKWAEHTLNIFRSMDFEPRLNPPLVKKKSILLAGPWVGEFGWELFVWHGYIRAISKYFDEVICIGRPTSQFLYEDFAQFIPFTPTGGESDSWFKNNFSIDGLLYSKFLKENNIDTNNSSVTIFPPRRIGDPPRTHFSEKMQLGAFFEGPKYQILGKGKKDYKQLIFHARNRTLRPQDNWSRENWEELASLFSKEGYNIVSIGTPQESMHISNTTDMRGCESSQLVNLLASSAAIFGPSSGAMHLGSLCGCPQVVWTTDYNLDRYTKNWNPHDTSVLFLSKHGWNPSPYYVYNEFVNWENK